MVHYDEELRQLGLQAARKKRIEAELEDLRSQAQALSEREQATLEEQLSELVAKSTLCMQQEEE